MDGILAEINGMSVLMGGDPFSSEKSVTVGRSLCGMEAKMTVVRFFKLNSPMLPLELKDLLMRPTFHSLC